ncbi:MAG: carbohydrate ABC transporter permease [Bacilli bacterium]|nr:carbohydrate ABC transporter permease [Bacilli bacterium]
METLAQRKRKHILGETKFYTLKVLAIFILVIVAFIMIFPYLYMLSLSFKTADEVINNSAVFYLIPKEFTFNNYITIFTDENIMIGRGFLNTFIIEFFVLIIGTFVTTLAGYAFSRINFFGKNVLFYMLLTGMMIPYIAVLAPQYLVFAKLKMINTLLPLIIPGLFGNVSMLFFIKQYADTIPNEIYEAAEINGAGFFRTYFELFLPLIKPALFAQVIFWFLGIWNDFFGPDIYLNKAESQTLQIVIRNLSTGSGGSDSLLHLPEVMSASVLSSIPTLLIYIIFQKHFVNTFMLSGSKH